MILDDKLEDLNGLEDLDYPEDLIGREGSICDVCKL